MPRGDVFTVEIRGKRCPAAVVKRIKTRRMCKKHVCWEERYAIRYLPRELEPGEGETLIIVKVDKVLISGERTRARLRTS